MKRVGKLGARRLGLHACGVAGEREQDRSQDRKRRNEWFSPDAEEQRDALGQNAWQQPPAGCEDEQSEPAGKRGPERDVHGRIGPRDARPDAAQTPDDKGTQPSQEPEVLEPMKRREDEVRRAAQARPPRR